MNSLIPVNYNNDTPTVLGRDYLQVSEVWRDVVGYEGAYSVSNLGNVVAKSRRVIHPRGGDALRRERDIKQEAMHNGYRRVRLYSNGKSERLSVHRIVALAFIPNPYNKPEVNHINGIKHDNRASNLEWCTKSENEKHAYRTGLKTPSFGMLGFTGKANKRSKIVLQRSLDRRVIGRFYGTAEAARKTGSEQSSIVRCANGILKTHNGFIWEYA